MGSSRRMVGIGRRGVHVGLAAIPVARQTGARTQRTRDTRSCVLGNGAGRIKHVIYIQFDNIHLQPRQPKRRLRSGQMPHLLNFMKGNGTLFTNIHDPDLAHGRRDPSAADGPLPRPDGHDRDELLRLLPAERHRPTFTLRVPVLDLAGERPPTTHCRTWSPTGQTKHAGSVGVVHAGRLRRRQRWSGEHRAGEQLDATSVLQRLRRWSPEADGVRPRLRR